MACGVLLVSCSGEHPTVALPTQADPVSASPSSSTPSVSPEAEAEAIKYAYQQFTALLDRADRLPASTRRQELSMYMADPQLSRVLNRIEELHADNLTAYGSTIVHVKNVLIDGDNATLHDCQDTRKAGLMKATTRKKINRGIKEEHIKALLIKGSDGRWRVRKSISLGQGC